MIKEKNKKKTTKEKCRFRGEELLLDRQLQIILGEKLFGPQASDLDDLSCTRCAPTIATRPSRNYIYNKYKLSV